MRYFHPLPTKPECEINSQNNHPSIVIFSVPDIFLWEKRSQELPVCSNWLVSTDQPEPMEENAFRWPLQLTYTVKLDIHIWLPLELWDSLAGPQKGEELPSPQSTAVLITFLKPNSTKP
jgi:hypothetical protein